MQDHKRVFALVTFIVSTLVCLILAELVVRIIYEDKFAARPAVYDHDPELGWVPGPNLAATFYGSDFFMHIDTDERGFRLGAGGPVSKTSPIFILVGDSYSFGWGVSGQETFASYLDERLSNYEEAPARLVNLGVGGYGTLAGAARLRRFVQNDESVHRRLRAIIVMHSHNDMADNVLYSLFRSGFRAPIANHARLASESHFFNLMKYVLSVWRMPQPVNLANNGATVAATTQRRELQDVLFAYPLKWTDKKSGEVMLDVGESIPFYVLTENDYSAKLTQGQKSMSAVQLQLLQRSIDELNCAFSFRPVTVIHATIHSAPDWYVEPIKSMVENSETCGNEVLFAGRINISNKSIARIYNNHSAGHFTPEANELYGDRLFAILRSSGVVGVPLSEDSFKQ